MLPDETQRHGQVAPVHAVILGQFDLGVEPKLGLATWPLDMHMQPRLLARKEEESKASRSKYRRAHGGNLACQPLQPRIVPA